MKAASAAPAGVPANAGMSATRRPGRLMVDAPTRMFHWLFAGCFVLAYLSGDSERLRAVHVTLGYTMAGLLGFRLLWGTIGPRHARLAPRLRRLAGLPAWLAQARHGRIALLPAGFMLVAGSVAALLASLVPLLLTGYGSYQEWAGDWLADLHEAFGQAMLGLVLAHLAAIALVSLLRRRNAASPMTSGRESGPGPDLVRNNHAVVAWLLAAGCGGFWLWSLLAGQAR